MFKWITKRKIIFVKFIIKYLKCKLHLMRVHIVDHNQTWVLLTGVHLSLFSGDRFFQAALQFTVTMIFYFMSRQTSLQHLLVITGRGLTDCM